MLWCLMMSYSDTSNKSKKKQKPLRSHARDKYESKKKGILRYSREYINTANTWMSWHYSTSALCVTKRVLACHTHRHTDTW